MCSGPDVPRSIGSWRHGVRVLQRRRRGGEGKGRVAPLLKSRDPHLAGGGKMKRLALFPYLTEQGSSEQDVFIFSQRAIEVLPLNIALPM